MCSSEREREKAQLGLKLTFREPGNRRVFEKKDKKKEKKKKKKKAELVSGELRRLDNSEWCRRSYNEEESKETEKNEDSRCLPVLR